GAVGLPAGAAVLVARWRDAPEWMLATLAAGAVVPDLLVAATAPSTAYRVLLFGVAIAAGALAARPLPAAAWWRRRAVRAALALAALALLCALHPWRESNRHDAWLAEEVTHGHAPAWRWLDGETEGW